jgi:predicted HNH restriction endonuclease
MRRWALKNGKAEHQKLLNFFRQLTKALTSTGTLPNVSDLPAENDEGHEGQVKKLLVKHRKRENRKRREKIATALRKGNGRLICEVPNCGFDFHARYGELGVGFAEVHHKKPLSDAPTTGRAVKLADLAIVCANCHRMIHIGGQCRPLASLIPRNK